MTSTTSSAARNTGWHQPRRRSAAAPFVVRGVRWVAWIEGGDAYVWESTCGTMRAWRTAQWIERIGGKQFERRRYRASWRGREIPSAFASLPEAMVAAMRGK